MSGISFLKSSCVDLSKSPMMTGCCPSLPSKKKPKTHSPPVRASDSEKPPEPPPALVGIKQYAQGKSSLVNSSFEYVWYPRIATLTLLLNPGSSSIPWTGSSGKLASQVLDSHTCPNHQENPSLPIL